MDLRVLPIICLKDIIGIINTGNTKYNSIQRSRRKDQEMNCFTFKISMKYISKNYHKEKKIMLLMTEELSNSPIFNLQFIMIKYEFKKKI